MNPHSSSATSRVEPKWVGCRGLPLRMGRASGSESETSRSGITVAGPPLVGPGQQLLGGRDRLVQLVDQPTKPPDWPSSAVTKAPSRPITDSALNSGCAGLG
jgi:hypothetical protein